MKKINCYSITRIKPLLYTTILIILFMIIIPIISIEGKINLEPNEYIEDQGVSMQTSAEVNTDIYINGDEKMGVEYKIGSIPNFYSLVPMSQTAHKPIFDLTNIDGVVGAHYQKVKDYEVLMESIANQMLRNMEAIV